MKVVTPLIWTLCLPRAIAEYRVFSLCITAVRDSASDAVQLAAFSLFDENENFRAPTLIQNPNGASPESEMPANLLAGNLTAKWLDHNFDVQGRRSRLVLEYDNPFVPSSCSLTTVPQPRRLALCHALGE
jgi:hypothetical protein